MKARIAATLAIVAGLSLNAASAQEQRASTAAMQTVEIDAIAAQGAPPVRDNVTFKFVSYNPGQTEYTASSTKGKPARIALPQGRYHLITTYGATQRSEDISVTDKTSSHVVTLNSGWVELKLLPNVTATPSKDPNIKWQIYTHRKGMDGNRPLIYQTSGAHPLVALPAGWYVIHAISGNKTSKHSVEVQKGNALEYRLVHN